MASASGRSSSGRNPGDRSPSRAYGRLGKDRTGRKLDSVAIITTPANRLLGVIAERMPAILPPGAFDLWLDCAAVDAERAAAFLVPAPEALLEAYPVSTAVNRTANDGPALIEPVSATEASAPPAAAPAVAAPKRSRKPKPDDRQPSLFQDP